MRLNELVSNNWAFVYLLDMDEDFDFDKVERYLGGERIDSHTLTFPTREEAEQAKRKLRRLSRGKPSFTVEWTEIRFFDEEKGHWIEIT